MASDKFDKADMATLHNELPGLYNIVFRDIIRLIFKYDSRPLLRDIYLDRPAAFSENMIWIYSLACQLLIVENRVTTTIRLVQIK